MATTVAVTDTKVACPQRGFRIKLPASTVDLTDVKLMKKNPARPGTRFYGFLQAFCGKANRVATVQQMVDAHWKHQDDIGRTRDPLEAVLRDLGNYISAWLDPSKTGSRGLHLNIRRVDGEGRIRSADKMRTKYEFVSWRKDSSFAEKARKLGWPVA
jgi:hypothetical protein